MLHLIYLNVLFRTTSNMSADYGPLSAPDSESEDENSGDENSDSLDVSSQLTASDEEIDADSSTSDVENSTP